MSSYDNPLQTSGFAFVEFATNDKNSMAKYLEPLGFTEVAVAQNYDVSIYQQGNILFIVNNSSDHQVSEFAKLHGNAASAMGFYVADPELAHAEALKRGAKSFANTKDSVWENIPAIWGVGGSVIYFVSRDDDFLSRFNFIREPGNICGLQEIDHLTHNVNRGQMVVWADFYSSVFGFREIRYFDIDGKKSGLLSKAMISPCDKIKIPLNESKDDKSQIEEFLREFNGEGIQHIALTSKNIYDSVEKLKQNGIVLMNTADTYYELVESRLPNHGENLDLLKKYGILIDGTTMPKSKLLLQIFTQNLFGPAFLEIIQRKGDDGFGEGNFQALFDSIELEQERRGAL